MKRKTLFLSLVLSGILACTESATEPLPATDDAILPTKTAAAPAGDEGFLEKITGSGHFVTVFPAYTPGVWRTFTISARKAGDGPVDGKAKIVLHPKGGPADVVRLTVTCFTVEGNTAWIGAHKPGNVPTDVAFQVVDNGEGSGDSPDQVGLYIEAQVFGYPAGFAQDFCDDTPEFMDFGPDFGVLPVSVLLSPVVGGNVQIH